MHDELERSLMGVIMAYQGIIIDIFWEGLRKTMKQFSQDNWCPD
jgi:hypothetical protein